MCSLVGKTSFPAKHFRETAGSLTFRRPVISTAVEKAKSAQVPRRHGGQCCFVATGQSTGGCIFEWYHFFLKNNFFLVCLVFKDLGLLVKSVHQEYKCKTKIGYQYLFIAPCYSPRAVLRSLSLKLGTQF